MYNSYAFRQGIIDMLREQRERIMNDQEYCNKVALESGILEIASRMTEEDWKKAYAKYGYKEDETNTQNI